MLCRKCRIGEDIVCTVTKDVNKEVELKVICQISDSEINKNENIVGDLTNLEMKHSTEIDLEDADEVLDIESTKSDFGDEKNETVEKMNGEMKAAISSKSNRNRSPDVQQDALSNNCVSPSNGIIDSEKLSDDKEDETRASSSLNETESIHTNEDKIIFKCPCCSFSTSDSTLLDKHIRNHRNSPRKHTASLPINTKSFCDACKIQFMSVDTFLVHKTYYCKTRHEIPLETIAASESNSAATRVPDTVIINSGANSSVIQPQAIYAAISTNPLILLPCSLVSGKGLVATNGVVPTGGPSIVLQTGGMDKLKDESGPPSRKTSHPIMGFLADKQFGSSSSLRKRKISEGDALCQKRAREKDPEIDSDMLDQEAPLDLSRKRKDSEIESRKVLVSMSSIGSPHSGSASSPVQRYTTSMHTPERSSPSSETERLVTGMPPPSKLLKHGNNVCEECHIVFYKYDNYLAHKKHYCAFRRRQLMAMAASSQEHSSDDNSDHSSTATAEAVRSCPSDETKSIDGDHPAESHFRSVITKQAQSVFCCDACGVKFSTQDNLNAHQTYYCIKKADSAMSKAVASRNANSGSPHEPSFVGPEEWKCNFCDATCSSYETMRRHLLTHSEMRGFRCIICGYKGNTLRGMRSHAFDHLTDRNISLDEFVQSTVIAENGGIPVIQQTFDASDEDSNPSRDTAKPEKSLLKETLLVTDSDLNEKAESLLNNKDFVAVTIKSEPEDEQPACSSSPIRDVLVKVEHDLSSNESKEFDISVHSDEEIDIDKKPQLPNSTSVIRRASPVEGKRENLPETSTAKKKKGAQQRELKYCNSCDISFYHLSNFLAHKKYYCVSRVMQNCLQETATVQ